MTETKRVWIIGAGFSRSLGAPLLPDLLSMRRWRDLLSKYRWLLSQFNEEPHDLLAAAVGVYLLYHWGKDFPEGGIFGQEPSQRGEKHFEDAEDFLVRLEHTTDDQLKNLLEAALGAIHQVDAKSKVPRNCYDAELKWEVLQAISKPTFVEAAKLLLALECEEFVKEDWENLEEFTPYRAWADKLTNNDSIVSFNYDRVVEKALRGACLVVGDKSPEGSQIKPQLHKMHGSTDWRLDGNEVKQEEKPCTVGKYVPFIAIPGRSKSTDTGRLNVVWTRARQSLVAADEVYIVGYGMPESDAKAREFLLRSLADNKQQHLKVTVVLGEPGFRTSRLEATLWQTLSRRRKGDNEQGPLVSRAGAVRVDQLPLSKWLTTKIQPQYAQDFIQGWALGYRD